MGHYCFFFNDTATTEIYTLSLHDALPILTDDITFTLPMEWASEPMIGWFVLQRLQDMFEYRHKVTREACEGK